MKAKKSLGQNFLRDKRILKKIADFARIEKNGVVVEIGPGEGTLTKLLLEQAKQVIAVEKDGKLVELLKEKFKFQILKSKLKIIHGDILDLEPEKSYVNEPCERDWREHEEFSSKKISVRENRSFFSANKYVLVGNIPYYITGALFKKFLESTNPPKSITFVVQKEVAERIMARDSKESILSISIKVYGTPEYGGIIKAGSFYPRPKVDSAIIAVRDISKKRFEEITPLTPLILRGESEKKFFEIVGAGFAHKRKLLVRNLEKIKGHPLGQNSSRVPLGNMSRTLLDTFKKCGISEKARAENLKVDDWVCLTREF